MTCPRCGSNNVSVQMVSDVQLKQKHHSLIWWLLIGWWYVVLKWCIFPLFALIVKIFAPKKQEIRQNNYSMCVCQNCGYNWKA